MNRLLLFIIALLVISIVVPVHAQKKSGNEIKWYSFENAMELNKKNKKKKKLFIDVYTDWCGWCKKMESESFQDSSVIAIMNKYFIAVKLNAEGKDTIKYGGDTYVNPSPQSPRSTHQLAITLLQGQMSYPAFVFMNTDGTSITVVKGYRPPSDIIPVLKYYGDDIYLTQSWADYLKSVNNSR